MSYRPRSPWWRVAERQSQSGAVGMERTSPRYPHRRCGAFTSETTPAACAARCRGHFYTRTSGVTNFPAAPWATSAANGRRLMTCSFAFCPTITRHRFMSACVRRSGAESSSVPIHRAYAQRKQRPSNPTSKSLRPLPLQQAQPASTTMTERRSSPHQLTDAITPSHIASSTDRA